MMYVFDVLIEIFGYTTARVVLPVVSFGRVYVQPLKSKANTFNALGFRSDENGRIEVSETMAGGIGFLIFLVVLVIIIQLIRVIGSQI